MVIFDLELIEYTHRFLKYKISVLYFCAESESRTDINRINDQMAYTTCYLRQVPSRTFLTLDPTQSDPSKTENVVTRPVDGPDPCPTLRHKK